MFTDLVSSFRSFFVVCCKGPEGGDYIARLLRENFYISELDLAQNKIQSPGAQAISMTLIDNSSIKKLNLSWNELKNKDAVYLTEAIRVNQTLTWLDLSHNGFAEEAGLLFGEGSYLFVLFFDLYNNALSNHGGSEGSILLLSRQWMQYRWNLLIHCLCPRHSLYPQ